MKIVSFRIKNFRSIVDTGRIELSADGVTALVGQNESGKSAVLDALAITFSSGNIAAEDCRYGESLPVITIETQSELNQLEEFAATIVDESIKVQVLERVMQLGGKLSWRFFGFLNDAQIPRMTFIFDNLDLHHLNFETVDYPSELAKDAETRQRREISNFRDLLWDAAPSFVPFDEESGLLPNRIDVSSEAVLKGDGSSAAENFLTIAGITLSKLMDSETKAQTALLKRANKKITDDFRAFWKQNIGESSGIELSCAIHQYPLGKEKQGQTFLEFLISDGENTLHPKQRSRGTRWFISFFLQLRASEEENSDHFYLLDEPGSNLHERAQTDVMELIEKISPKIGVIYSTHSPHLIRQDRLNRIIAVERDAEKNGHPTKLIGAHALGAANTDTLSPIYVAMGVSLARQTSIKQKNNVILEELSAQYFLRAFWVLCDCKSEVNFLAATGVSNVPMLCNLFLGWGLEYVVVIDDEPSARSVFNRMKRDMFLDDGVWAKRRILKIPDCDGVEDVFDGADYQAFVAQDAVLKDGQKNSHWAKTHGAAKAIHALKFLQGAESGAIKLGKLQPGSRERISKLVVEINDRLTNYAHVPPAIPKTA
ncbi:ATP-dependent nuclease [Variovorax paradoxus]|uniref:ATP-dependent nuclease n=1 Tax=Variovorax paradoxus TaxID=34073 RepID=UPI003D64BE55